LQGEDVKRKLEAMPLNVDFQSAHAEAFCSSEGEADIATGLATDAVSPLYNGLRVVTEYFSSLTTERDVLEDTFLKECQEAAMEKLDNQSVNGAGIRTHAESSAYVVGACREVIDGASSFAKCVRADAVGMKWSRHAVKLQELTDQCEDVAALKQQLVKVTEERDALRLEACRNRAAKKEKDALELEIEAVRARYEEDVTELKDKLIFLRAERDYLDTRAQSRAEGMEAVLEEKVALEIKLENVRARYKEDVMQLKEQLQTVRTQRGEQDILVLRAERIAQDIETVKVELGAVELELGSVRARYREEVMQLKDQLHIARTQRDEKDVRAQRIAEDLQAMKEEKAAMEAELENIRSRYKKEVTQLKDHLVFLRAERDDLDIQAQRIAEDMETAMEDNGALQLQLENVRAKYKEDVTQLRDQLRVLRAQRDEQDMRTQRIAEDMEAIEQKGALQLEQDKFSDECIGAGFFEKELNAARAERDRIVKERDALKLNSRHHAVLLEEKLDGATVECEHQAITTGVKSDSIMKERDDLRCEVKKLRHQCRGIPMLKMELNIVRTECDKLKRQRDFCVRD
jgi:DNA uptake protein ComE-like DNA-binding protein